MARENNLRELTKKENTVVKNEVKRAVHRTAKWEKAEWRFLTDIDFYPRLSLGVILKMAYAKHPTHI